MTGVGLGRPRGVLQPVLPRLPADLGIGHVVLQRGHALGPGVAGPHPVRAAEVGDAAVGADARAGEHDDPLGLVDPAADLVDVGSSAGTGRLRDAPLTSRSGQ